MLSNNIPEIIQKETEHLSDDLLKEVLDFILFLKSKNQKSLDKTEELSSLQQNELTHLEDEFKNYKNLYPNE